MENIASKSLSPLECYIISERAKKERIKNEAKLFIQRIKSYRCQNYGTNIYTKKGILQFIISTLYLFFFFHLAQPLIVRAIELDTY